MQYGIHIYVHGSILITWYGSHDVLTIAGITHDIYTLNAPLHICDIVVAHGLEHETLQKKIYHAHTQT